MTTHTSISRTFTLAALLALGCTGLAGSAAPKPPHDARLDTRVDVWTASSPLSESLENLTTTTTAKLDADELLRNRRVTVYCRGRQAGAAMEHLAWLLACPPGECLWECSHGDLPSYTLHEDTASKNARELLAKRRTAALRNKLRDVLAMSHMSEDQLAGLRDKYPEATAMMSSERRLLHLAESVPGDQIQSLLGGAPVNVGYDSFPAPQQAIARSMVSGLDYSYGTLDRNTGGHTMTGHFNGKTDFAAVHFSMALSGSPETPGIGMFVRMPDGDGLGLPDVLSPPFWRHGQNPPAWLEAATRKQNEARKVALHRGHRKAPNDDPELLQKVTIRCRLTKSEVLPGEPGPRATLPADALRQVALQTKIPVIADYDSGYEDYYGPRDLRTLKDDLVEVPLWQALDKIADLWDLQWDKKNGWIRVRSPRAIWAMRGEIDLYPPWEIAKIRREKAAEAAKAPGSDSPKPAAPKPPDNQ